MTTEDQCFFACGVGVAVAMVVPVAAVPDPLVVPEELESSDIELDVPDFEPVSELVVLDELSRSLVRLLAPVQPAAVAIIAVKSRAFIAVDFISQLLIHELGKSSRPSPKVTLLSHNSRILYEPIA